MKTLKFTFKTILSCAFIMVILTACAQSDSQEASKAAQPDMDIQAAVISGNLEAVIQHIEAGTDLNKPEPMGGSTPLISAATFGETEIAKALIEAGADLSVKNNDGATALHAAAFFCRVEIVQLLIDADADKMAKNNYGSTARESVMGPFSEIKPIYQVMKEKLKPLGLELDLEEVEKTRPVIAMMLQ